MRKNENGNRKPEIGNGTFVRILLVGIVLCSLVMIPASAAKLATPVLVSPANNQHFFDQSKMLGLYWNSVQNADVYTIRIEKKDGTNWNKIITQNINANSFNFYIYYPLNPLSGKYRWNVQAKSLWVLGIDSNPSAWRMFDYPEDPSTTFKLATPVLISPATNTIFKGGGSPEKIVLAWKPVPGASGYLITIYNKESSSSHSWMESGGLNTCTKESMAIFTTGKFEWWVKAYGSNGYSDSDQSKHNSFTINA